MCVCARCFILLVSCHGRFLPACVGACLFPAHQCVSSGGLEGHFTECMAACLVSCLSVSPLGLGGELARVADVSLSRWRAGVEVLLGCQRSRVGNSRTWHLGHQGLQKGKSEFWKSWYCCHFKALSDPWQHVCCGRKETSTAKISGFYNWLSFPLSLVDLKTLSSYLLTFSTAQWKKGKEQMTKQFSFPNILHIQ